MKGGGVTGWGGYNLLIKDWPLINIGNNLFLVHVSKRGISSGGGVEGETIHWSLHCCLTCLPSSSISMIIWDRILSSSLRPWVLLAFSEPRTFFRRFRLSSIFFTEVSTSPVTSQNLKRKRRASKPHGLGAARFHPCQCLQPNGTPPSSPSILRQHCAV